jgi:hypothetical protein
LALIFRERLLIENGIFAKEEFLKMAREFILNGRKRYR